MIGLHIDTRYCQDIKRCATLRWHAAQADAANSFSIYAVNFASSQRNCSRRQIRTGLCADITRFRLTRRYFASSRLENARRSNTFHFPSLRGRIISGSKQRMILRTDAASPCIYFPAPASAHTPRHWPIIDAWLILPLQAGRDANIGVSACAPRKMHH